MYVEFGKYRQMMQCYREEEVARVKLVSPIHSVEDLQDIKGRHEKLAVSVDGETYIRWGLLTDGIAIWAAKQSCSDIRFVPAPGGMQFGLEVYVHEDDFQKFHDFVFHEITPLGCQSEKDK
jgi:hypothetical protein